MTDRSSRETDLIKITGKKAKNISRKIIARLKKKEKIHTLTFDNDLAFADHESIAKHPNVKTYFTRPYTSQDKGSVENRIGQIIDAVERKLNNRPFRMFGYLTAIEMKNKLNN